MIQVCSRRISLRTSNAVCERLVERRLVHRHVAPPPAPYCAVVRAVERLRERVEHGRALRIRAPRACSCATLRAVTAPADGDRFP